MKRAIREYAGSVVAIVVLVIIAVATGAYIFAQQKLRTPFQDRYTVKVDLAATEGLEPGLGQGVEVAGVRVGDITGAELDQGRSLVTLSIDPHKLPHVYRDARAELIPNTPLKDLYVQIQPGHANTGDIKDPIPVERTTVPIDADELTGALDTDTRDYFQALINAAGLGLKHRALDLRALFKALGPTAREARELTGALAARRHVLARLVHDLAVLTHSAAPKDREIAQVIDAGNATLRAVAGEDVALRSSLSQLPPTISAARDTLHHASAFARELPPTVAAIDPAVRALPGTLRLARPLLAESEPILRTRLRPLVRALQPVVPRLVPVSRRLNKIADYLPNATRILTYVVNELGYNPPGSNEGFLFWLAWFAHNTNTVTSTDDAQGAVLRGLALVSCSSLITNTTLTGQLASLLGQLPVCPKH